MNKEEISKLMALPFPKLAEACKNPETLATVLSIAVNLGIKLGRADTHESYNKMFHDHDGVSITN